MSDLAPGLYERLVTEGLARELIAHGDLAQRRPLDQVEAADVLTAHLAALTRRALRSLRGTDAERLARQVELANRLVAVLGEVAQDDLVASSRELLLAVTRRRTPAGEPVFPQRPQTPLAASALLVNGHGQPSVGHELKRELASADRVDLLCAFVRWYGVRILEDELSEFVRRGGRLRVITTTYRGATERRALDRLAELGAHIKVSYETKTTRLHAKAWLFHRETGFSTAYVGSSNLSKSALIDGLEWNVRLSGVEQPHLLDTFAATFEEYWGDPAFEDYDPASAQARARLDEALELEGAGPRELPLAIASLDVRPYGYQSEVLAELAAERQIHNRRRNLVVMATGTGKTVVSALDYRGLREAGEVDSLLFVAHREEILIQSLATFRQVLRDGAFGELYVGGRRPEQWRHVFASIQSLHRIAIEDPAAFDMVIVDEFHHAEAATYTRLLNHLKPRVLLGLTATPERADGQDVKHWFGGRIAVELRLWEAIERQLLAPFQYFGVHDGVDLSEVPWKRGQGYDLARLSDVFTGNDARVRLVLQTLRRKVGDVGRMRALGFCVSVEHAEYMARRFTEAGIPALAITSRTPRADREAGLRKLRSREINAVFAVDLFNEGVDIPSIDTVLFLRPTDSATVFLQQLGRGLRLDDGKACLTVLDFIGNQHRRFRFDRRYRALTGASRTGVAREVEAGFPTLPPGCHIDLDREVSRLVLDNIRQTLNLRWPDLAAELASLPERTTLAAFLEETGLELEDLYRRRPGWAALRRAAGRGATAGPQDERIGRALGRMLHIDDPDRLAFLRRPRGGESLREQRLLAMLDAALWGGAEPASTAETRLAELLAHPDRVSELRELAGVLAERRHRVTHPLPGDIPLHVHATYSKNEALAAFGVDRPAHMREGVKWVPEANADLFFVTIDQYEEALRHAAWSSGSAEAFVPFFDQLWLGPVCPAARHHQSQAVHLLQAVLEHRPVDLFEDIGPYLDHQVGTNPEDVLVIGGMVDLAQRQPVGHRGDAAFLPVRDDVGGIKQRQMPEVAHRAARLVRLDHPLPEDRLVEPPPGHADGVAALDLAHRPIHPDVPLRLLQRHGYLQSVELHGDDPHREERQIQALLHAEEPDEGQSKLIGAAEPEICVEVRVVALEFVAQQAIRSHFVLIGRTLAVGSVGGQDGEGGAQFLRLADAQLAIDETECPAFKLEVEQLVACDYRIVRSTSPLQPGHRCNPDSAVQVVTQGHDHKLCSIPLTHPSASDNSGQVDMSHVAALPVGAVQRPPVHQDCRTCMPGLWSTSTARAIGRAVPLTPRSRRADTGWLAGKIR
nr:DEAD/DEAH box helicase family protein [Thermoactinospora rubra]